MKKTIVISEKGNYAATIDIVAILILVFSIIIALFLLIAGVKTFWIYSLSLIVGGLFVYMVLKAISKILENTWLTRKLQEEYLFQNDFEIIYKED